MPFPVKTIDEIFAEFMQALDDLKSPLAKAKYGSFTYFVGRAVSSVVSTGYRAIQDIREEFFVSLSSGEALRRRVRDLGMMPDPGDFAVGGVVISLPAGKVATLSAGEFLYSTTDRNIRFEVLGSAILDAVPRHVRVMASEVGDKHNLTAGTPLYSGRADLAGARILASNNAPVSGSIPDGDFTGGRDPESDQQIKDRFAQYFKSFARGVGYAVLVALKDIPGLRATAVKNAIPVPGYFTVVVGNDASELTEELRAVAEARLDEWAAAGYGFEFEPLLRKRVPIEVSVKVSDRTLSPASVEAGVSAAILTAIANVSQGESLYRSEITRAGKIPGVTDLEVLQPAQSVLASPSELIVADGVIVHASYV